MATYEVTTEKGTYQVDTEGQQAQQQSTQQGQQPNILQQLLQAGVAGPLGQSQSMDMLGKFARGAVEPFVQSSVMAGEGIDSLISGQPPQSVSVPFPQALGGNINVNPPQNLGQAIAPGVEAGLTMASIPASKVAGSMAESGINTLKQLTKFDNSLVQAKKGKIALDTLRNTLGQAKQIALEEIKDVPAELNWAGQVSQKVITAIQNPIYKVEFTEEGGVVNTIGNLDKVKSALKDLITTKDYVEAGNMEKRQIMQFAGRVRDTMVNAANSAGKPQLAKSLKDYHKFMDNYDLINDKLVDKYGNAMANKLKTTFKIFSEPAVKEAWKEVAKSSPEIKGVMNSMNHRELLKNLLKTSGVVAGAGLAGKGTFDLISSK